MRKINLTMRADDGPASVRACMTTHAAMIIANATIKEAGYVHHLISGSRDDIVRDNMRTSYKHLRRASWQLFSAAYGLPWRSFVRQLRLAQMQARHLRRIV